MTRVAAVDLGTNSTRLLVADVDGDTLDEVTRRLTITRLGEGVDKRRRLLPVPMTRVRNCLTEYRRELEALGAERTLCIATSSARDAENGEAFLGEIEWGYGFTTRLLTGTEEAAMMIRGVTAGRAPLDDALVVDIGGGSTELVLAADGVVAFSTSLDIGCVRITERFLGSDPPSRPELAAAGAYVRSLLPPLEASSAIGVAGTVTTLATIDLGDASYDPDRTHGHALTLAAVEAQLERLAAMTTEERLAVPAIEPGRASVIVAGIVVLREVMTTYELTEIEVSERDVLHGAAFAAAELPGTARRAPRLPAPTPAADAQAARATNRRCTEPREDLVGLAALPRHHRSDRDRATRTPRSTTLPYSSQRRRRLAGRAGGVLDGRPRASASIARAPWRARTHPRPRRPPSASRKASARSRPPVRDGDPHRPDAGRIDRHAGVPTRHTLRAR